VADAAAIRFVPVGLADLDTLVAIETAAYPFPWSRGNFIDSLNAGYLARRRVDERGQWLGYFIAMPGVQEVHLLNLTVAPPHQGRGHARAMLDELVRESLALGAQRLWLEVRTSNQRAQEL
jgi:ribosomal-protein-alanine N-acetyltransferase